MWKAIAAGALVLSIGGASLVYAQQAAPNDSRPLSRRMTAEDAQAFADARIAALKAGLKLSPDQEKNWPAVETVLRDLAKQRAARMQAQRQRRDEARADNAPRDGIAMLRSRAEIMTERAAGLKRLADAAEPLYKSLDDGQKRRLRALAWSMRPHDAWRGGHRRL